MLFGIRKSRQIGPVRTLGEASEAAALNEARDADSCAAAALNITASLCCDGIVCLHPNTARTQRHGGLWCVRRPAPLRNEPGMHRDVIHVAGPNQQ